MDCGLGMVLEVDASPCVCIDLYLLTFAFIALI